MVRTKPPPNLDLDLEDPEVATPMRELLRLYTGPDALPVPPSLEEWVDAAKQWAEVLELKRRNDQRAARLGRKLS